MSGLDREGFLRTASTFYVAGVLEGEAFREAPERKRFQEAWERALSKQERWQDMVDRVQSELPNASVSDTTAPYAMASQRCCVYLMNREADEPARTYNVVIALASVLVPYYHLYQVGIENEAGDYIRGPPQPRPRDGTEGRVADLLARHVEQETGYQEFPSEYESIVVPEISVRNLLPGRATLLDALFDDARSNIP
ncbi:MAG TPA: hypothetical protein VIG99_15365 [Myxococcaceae bacterium]|jgi:hypothetical protein